MPRLPHRRLDERPAHVHVTANHAHTLWLRSNVEYPVSGDETLREVGRTLVRRAHHGNHLWSADWVRPKLPTAGIRVGDTITAYVPVVGDDKTGIVTRVGTTAGFASTDGLPGVHEWRWTVDDVIEFPTPTPRDSVH